MYVCSANTKAAALHSCTQGRRCRRPQRAGLHCDAATLVPGTRAGVVRPPATHSAGGQPVLSRFGTHPGSVGGVASLVELRGTCAALGPPPGFRPFELPIDSLKIGTPLRNPLYYWQGACALVAKLLR